MIYLSNINLLENMNITFVSFLL